MLKNFSPTWEGVKHIAGETVKYAAYGAAVLGGLAALPALGAGAAAGLFGAVGLPTSFAAGATTVLVKAASIGAGFGAAFGGVKSLTSVGEAVEYAKQDEIYKNQQLAIFKERQALMQAAQQGRGRGVTSDMENLAAVAPNIGVGIGRESGGYGLS